MNMSMLRTAQVGAALWVLALGIIAVLVIVGVMSQEQGLVIALNASAVIGICVATGIVLTLLFGAGSGTRDEP